MSTITLKFIPTEHEQSLIQQAAHGNRDASLDLAMLNILYDNETATWRKLPEDQEFEARRRRGFNGLH